MHQQIEECRYGVAHRLPAWRHISRGTQLNRIIPVAGQGSGILQTGRDTRLEQFRYHSLCTLRAISPASPPAITAATVWIHFPEGLPVAPAASAAFSVPQFYKPIDLYVYKQITLFGCKQMTLL